MCLGPHSMAHLVKPSFHIISILFIFTVDMMLLPYSSPSYVSTLFLCLLVIRYLHMVVQAMLPLFSHAFFSLTPCPLMFALCQIHFCIDLFFPNIFGLFQQELWGEIKCWYFIRHHELEITTLFRLNVIQGVSLT